MKIWQVRLCSDIIGEIMPLIEAHKEEVATYPDIPLCIDWEKYLAMQEMGQLKFFVIKNSGEIVGYVSCLVQQALHYNTSLQCFVDAVYLDPKARGRGIALFKHVEDAMKAKGVQVIQFHVKVQHDFSAALERLGYTFVEKIMAKRIG